MVNIGELEIISAENLTISKKEEYQAVELKKIAKIELKKAKVRENLTQKTLESSKIRKELAEKNHEIIERKIKNQNILHIPDAVLNNEKEYTLYNEKITIIQNKVAQIQEKIANIEKDIAEERIKFANRKLDLSKERRELSKLQSSYIKKYKKSSSKEKLGDVQTLYLSKEKDLEKARNRVMEKLNKIKSKENNLNVLKGDLSTIYYEQSKIKHSNINS